MRRLPMNLLRADAAARAQRQTMMILRGRGRLIFIFAYLLLNKYELLRLLLTHTGRREK